MVNKLIVTFAQQHAIVPKFEAIWTVVFPSKETESMTYSVFINRLCLLFCLQWSYSSSKSFLKRNVSHTMRRTGELSHRRKTSNAENVACTSKCTYRLSPHCSF